MSPVWFQSSSCSLRTTALFSSTGTFVSSCSVRFPDGPQHSVHDATRRYPVHPGSMPLPRPTRRQRREWDRYRLLVGGSQFDPRWERQLSCGAIGTFNEGYHPAQEPIHPLRYLAPVLSLALSCLMRHVRAWPSMNSPSAMSPAAGATCSVPSSVTFW